MDGWACYTIDSDWRMSAFNTEAVNILGFDPTGMILWEAFPDSETSEFGMAAKRARRLGVPVRNRSLYPWHGSCYESVTIPDGDTMRVMFRRIDILSKLEQLEAAVTRLTVAVDGLAPPPQQQDPQAALPSGRADRGSLVA